MSKLTRWQPLAQGIWATGPRAPRLPGKGLVFFGGKGLSTQLVIPILCALFQFHSHSPVNILIQCHH